jgi:hypothetical protein
MHNLCELAEQIIVNHRGWVDLLDMDHVYCRRGGQLQEISIEECVGCDAVEWSMDNVSADEWEHFKQEADADDIRVWGELKDSGE